MATNINKKEKVVKVLPTSRPLVTGTIYKVEQEDGTLLTYTIDSLGEPRFERGITEEQQDKLTDLPSVAEYEADLASKVSVVVGKSLVDDTQISKLQGLDTQTQTNEKIAQATAIAGGAPYPITGLALPQTPAVTDLPDRASANVYGQSGGSIYTQTGGADITVSQGKGRTVTYNKTTNLWTAGQEYDLPQGTPATSNKGQSTTIPASQKLATDADDKAIAIQGTRSISLGNLVNGRYTTVSTTDTNSAYRRSESMIPVDPTWVGQFNTSQSANTVTVQFDEFGQPIDTLTYTANTDFTFNPRTRFIIPSGLTADMAAKILTIRESLGTQTVDNISKVLENRRRNGVSLNYFNYLTDFMYQKTPAMDDGRIVSVSSAYSTTPLYRLRSRTQVIVGNIFVISNPIRVHWYRADGTQISYQEIPTASFRRTFSTNKYYIISEIPPTDAVYFRIRYEYGSSSTTAQLQLFFISNLEYIVEFETQYTFKNVISELDAIRLIRHEAGRTFKLIGIKICLIADSNGAAGNGTASYNTQVRDLNFPTTYEVLAQGGATISSTAVNAQGQQLFGSEYLSLPVSTEVGNTFIRQAEVIIDNVQNNPNYVKPDLILIIGGTNDFDKFRHVTPAMFTASGYPDMIEYMEATFMTQSPAYNTYIPLANVNRAQVSGALRYIVERLLTFLPNTQIIISTPIQSSGEHNSVYAQRTVRDIEHITERMSLPLIRMWHESNMPMFFDSKTIHRYLGDGVHLSMSGVNQPGANVAGRYLSDQINRKFIPYIAPIVT